MRIKTSWMMGQIILFRKIKNFRSSTFFSMPIWLNKKRNTGILYFTLRTHMDEAFPDTSNLIPLKVRCFSILNIVFLLYCALNIVVPAYELYF